MDDDSAWKFWVCLWLTALTFFGWWDAIDIRNLQSELRALRAAVEQYSSVEGE